MTKQFGCFDNLSDRRDLFMLLDRLGDGKEGNERRKQFLRWACKQAQRKTRMAYQVDEAKTTGRTQEIYLDLTALATVKAIDLEKTAIALEQLIRRMTA